LNWCHHQNPEKAYAELLKELCTCFNKIKELRLPEYNILRVQYASPVFEKEILSESNILNCKYKALSATTLTTNAKPDPKANAKTPVITVNIPLKASGSNTKDTVVVNELKNSINTNKGVKSKMLVYHSQDVDDYLIDLRKVHNLKEIRLALDNNDKVTKFRVQAWSLQALENASDNITPPKTVDNISSYSKTLLHSRLYSEDIWIQLSSAVNDERLTLGITNLGNVVTKYLRVQITYTLLPGVHIPTTKLEKKMVPEVYGNAEESGKPIKEAEGLFNVLEGKNLSFLKSMENANMGTKSDKYEITTGSTSYGNYMFLFNAPTSFRNKTQSSGKSSREAFGFEYKIFSDFQVEILENEDISLL